MAVNKLVRTLLAAGTFAVLGFSQSASATTLVGSLSTGLEADLSVLGVTTVNVGPVAYASGLGTKAYKDNESVASVSSSSNLVLGVLDLSTGVMTDTATSKFHPTIASSASSAVSALNLDLSLPLLGSLLGISADTLSSTTTASTKAFTGSSALANLTLSGLVVGSTFHPIIDGTVDQILFNAGGLLVEANYQSPIYFGSLVNGLQTSALAIKFNDFAFGSGLLNGVVVVGDSAASVYVTPDFPSFSFSGGSSAVPEVATWATMLLGLGLIGAATRHRQIFATA